MAMIIYENAHHICPFCQLYSMAAQLHIKKLQLITKAAVLFFEKTDIVGLSTVKNNLLHADKLMQQNT